MQLVEVKVNVPKEMQDVSVLLQNVVKAVKAKKSATEIAAAELPDLMAAIDGFSALSDEVKSPEAADCIALLGSGVYKALSAK